MEVKITTQRAKALGGKFRWTNTLQQLADGLTKVSARQQFAETILRGVHAIKFDPNFVAGKKLRS